jgi:hypothetical protein
MGVQMADVATGSKLNAVLGPIEVHLKDLINLFDKILGGTGTGSMVTVTNQAEINGHRDAIDPALPACPGSKSIEEEICRLKSELGLFADQLEEILNALKSVKRSFALADLNISILNTPPVVNRDGLTKLRQACRDALKQIRVLVTPFEFNEERLSQLRVGSSVDFNKEYEQELMTEIGSEDLRPKVLQTLYERKDVWGLVDREYGIVYKTSDTWGQYWARVAYVVALPILGFILVLAYCIAVDPPTPATTASSATRATASATPTSGTTPATASATPASLPGNDTEKKKRKFWPLAWYAICFGGYVAHVVKKLLNAAGKDPLVSDVVHWLEIKALPLAGLGVSLWVVFGWLLWQDIGGIRTGNGVGLETVMIAFTAGYFVDSFAEPLLKQFERRVSESKSSLTVLIKAYKPNS